MVLSSIQLGELCGSIMSGSDVIYCWHLVVLFHDDLVVILGSRHMHNLSSGFSLITCELTQSDLSILTVEMIPMSTVFWGSSSYLPLKARIFFLNGWTMGLAVSYYGNMVLIIFKLTNTIEAFRIYPVQLFFVEYGWMWVEISLWWYIIWKPLGFWRNCSIMYSWPLCKGSIWFHQASTSYCTSSSHSETMLLFSPATKFCAWACTWEFFTDIGHVPLTLATSGVASWCFIWVWPFSPSFSWLGSLAYVEWRSTVSIQTIGCLMKMPICLTIINPSSLDLCI